MGHHEDGGAALMYMATCTPNSYPDESGHVQHGFQINVLDDDMEIMTTIELRDWDEFLPASAGYRLIEHGWIIPPQRRDRRTPGGWRQVGISWMTQVVRT